MDRLKRLSTDLGVAEQVVFTGLIDYEKLPDYYNAADVCVFPSYYESFGLVPLESLACGTPVVAADVGNLKTSSARVRPAMSWRTAAPLIWRRRSASSCWIRALSSKTLWPSALQSKITTGKISPRL